MTENIITQKRLKKLLHYNPETGVFTWLKSGTGRRANGKAGCLTPNGYIRIRIDGSDYYAHRLAFLYMTGEWPIDEIDHGDHVTNDNRWDEISQVTHAVNMRNQTMRNTNASGAMGVFWDKDRSKWRAVIKINYKEKFLGYFVTYLAAVYARHAADIKYGFHPNHGS